MFTQAVFYFDSEGRPRPEPLTLSAEDVASKTFGLQSCRVRTMDGELPGIYLVRRFKDAETDPYNDDGRTATMLTTMAMPNVTFLGSAVEIVYLERPALARAGMLRPAYEGRPGLGLPPDRIWDGPYDGGSNHLADMRLQKVVLSRPR